VEVAQQYGCLRARDNQDDKDQEQKAEHVVDLAGPQGTQDKEQLNENAAKGQNAAHNDARNRLSVDRLVGNLTGNLVGTHWVLQGLEIKATKLNAVP